ncbi:MAG: hypothetical protein HY510_01025 [Acidobacteria bacterium]|nr:hypothetical protein [Acidobacteriota bacterium]
MDEGRRKRWEMARRELIHRWRLILERIEARDEGGVRALANVMDEFCDEAMAEKKASVGEVGRSARGDPGLATSAGPATGRCVFCRGFAETGGCFGVLGELDRRVLNGLWDEARRVALRYLLVLESMSFEAPPELRWRP